MEKTTQEERDAMTKMAQEKIEQKTRAATERVAMGLDHFTRKMLSENQYMVHEVNFAAFSLTTMDWIISLSVDRHA